MFFELEASRMRSNLFLINGMLTGTRYQGFSRDAIRSAWTSLFMVVPVLSSTFASFARSFGSLGAGEIGWLLVDEAGQAAPKQRSARYGGPGVHCWWAIPCNSSRSSPSPTPCSNTCARATRSIPIGSPIDNPRRRWAMKPPIGGAWRDRPMVRPG